MNLGLIKITSPVLDFIINGALQSPGIHTSAAGMPPLSSAAWTFRTFRLDGVVPARGPRAFLRVVTEAL
jgi:hypothetical protein